MKTKKSIMTPRRMRKDMRINLERKPIMSVIEKLGLAVRKSTKRIQKERTKGDRVYVKRMMSVDFRKDEKGYCDNVSEGEKRPEVKAGNDMCSVGMIRKGRSWGDYSGVFCAECPYFIPVKRLRVVGEIRK